MELSKRIKTRWIIEAMDFVNLTKVQLDEIKEFSLNKENIGTRYLIYDYNTNTFSLTLYTLLNGRVDGKMNNLTVVPSLTDSLYILSVGTVGLSTIYNGSNAFDEDDFKRCNDTYKDYMTEISQDFAVLFNNKIENILKSENNNN